MLIGNKLNFVKFPTWEVLICFIFFVQWQSYKLEIEACDSSKANYFQNDKQHLVLHSHNHQLL